MHFDCTFSKKAYLFRRFQNKKLFLIAFNDCFNDGMIRKMVLEVNSGNEDLISIISDLWSVGIAFVGE